LILFKLKFSFVDFGFFVNPVIFFPSCFSSDSPVAAKAVSFLQETSGIMCSTLSSKISQIKVSLEDQTVLNKHDKDGICKEAGKEESNQTSLLITKLFYNNYPITSEFDKPPTLDREKSPDKMASSSGSPEKSRQSRIYFSLEQNSTSSEGIHFHDSFNALQKIQGFPEQKFEVVRRQIFDDLKIRYDAIKVTPLKDSVDFEFKEKLLSHLSRRLQLSYLQICALEPISQSEMIERKYVSLSFEGLRPQVGAGWSRDSWDLDAAHSALEPIIYVQLNKNVIEKKIKQLVEETKQNLKQKLREEYSNGSAAALESVATHHGFVDSRPLVIKKIDDYMKFALPLFGVSESQLPSFNLVSDLQDKQPYYNALDEKFSKPLIDIGSSLGQNLAATILMPKNFNFYDKLFENIIKPSYQLLLKEVFYGQKKASEALKEFNDMFYLNMDNLRSIFKKNIEFHRSFLEWIQSFRRSDDDISLVEDKVVLKFVCELLPSINFFEKFNQFIPSEEFRQLLNAKKDFLVNNLKSHKSYMKVFIENFLLEASYSEVPYDKKFQILLNATFQAIDEFSRCMVGSDGVIKDWVKEKKAIPFLIKALELNLKPDLIGELEVAGLQKDLDRFISSIFTTTIMELKKVVFYSRDHNFKEDARLLTNFFPTESNLTFLNKFNQCSVELNMQLSWADFVIESIEERDQFLTMTFSSYEQNDSDQNILLIVESDPQSPKKSAELSPSSPKIFRPSTPDEIRSLKREILLKRFSIKELV
jgi:hypothetical protein